MVEKITVYDGGRLIVSLLEGTEFECEIEQGFENEPVGVVENHHDWLFFVLLYSLAGICCCFEVIIDKTIL